MSVVPKIKPLPYAEVAEQWNAGENAMSTRQALAVWLCLSLIGWGGIFLAYRSIFG